MAILDIFKSNKINEELAIDNHNLQTQIVELTKLNEDNKLAIEKFATAKLEWETTLDITKKEFEAKLTDALAQVELAKTSANKQAATIVASLGVELETIPVATKPSNIDILKTLEVLQGTERTEFYNANRETILKALNLNK